ncbi:lysozyme inhibitor LprI family protein [Sphingomonas sp. C3-2]|uniref:lysozyme inhibitor LprI family protein n=1 Tax=Sphingomonas sp. C3-2 TaxID=3062169 RepID=UPI00294B7B33|nr:lysozyme inhibitor LprI family protein [Sphingomonas sp. C3-2]WOK37292.1 lysozyme inhibitor LprI family protein [Sphingomonas sp. C3-2]
MNTDEKRCPSCAETIKAAALICRHCQHPFDATEVAALAAEAEQARAAHTALLKKRLLIAAAIAAVAVPGGIYLGKSLFPAPTPSIAQAGQCAASDIAVSLAPGMTTGVVELSAGHGNQIVKAAMPVLCVETSALNRIHGNATGRLEMDISFDPAGTIQSYRRFTDFYNPQKPVPAPAMMRFGTLRWDPQSKQDALSVTWLSKQELTARYGIADALPAAQPFTVTDMPEQGENDEPGEERSAEYQQCMDESEGVTVTMMDCIAIDLGPKDDLLNTRYKAVIAALPDAKAEQLRALQRDWIRQRDRLCDEKLEEPGGTLGQVIRRECLLTETNKRIAFLNRYR